jgi:hypothetical protein
MLSRLNRLCPSIADAAAATPPGTPRLGLVEAVGRAALGPSAPAFQSEATPVVDKAKAVERAGDRAEEYRADFRAFLHYET